MALSLSGGAFYYVDISLWWHWLELWLICQCRTISAPQRAPIHCIQRHIIDVAYSPRTWKYEHKRTTWQREKVEHNALSTYAVRGYGWIYIYIFGWCAGVYMKRLEYDLWCAKYCALKNVANRCAAAQCNGMRTHNPTTRWFIGFRLKRYKQQMHTQTHTINIPANISENKFSCSINIRYECKDFTSFIFSVRNNRKYYLMREITDFFFASRLSHTYRITQKKEIITKKSLSYIMELIIKF